MDKQDAEQFEALWKALVELQEFQTEQAKVGNQESKLAMRSALQTSALELLIKAVLAMTAIQQRDPLRYLDDVRRLTQDSLNERLEGVGDELERILSKVQAAVVREQKRRGGANLASPN